MTAIVIEDGTVLDGSPRPNSFVTVDEYKAFYTIRLDTVASEGDDEAICAALVYAWDYLNQEFRLRFRGSLAKAFQAGTWPRRGVPVPDFFDPFFRNTNVPFEFRHTVFIPENTVPVEVKEAQMLLARDSQTTASSADNLQPALGRVTKREKLGDLEVEYMAGDQGGKRQTTLFWEATKRLQPLLRPTNVGTVVRS